MDDQFGIIGDPLGHQQQQYNNSTAAAAAAAVQELSSRDNGSGGSVGSDEQQQQREEIPTVIDDSDDIRRRDPPVTNPTSPPMPQKKQDGIHLDEIDISRRNHHLLNPRRRDPSPSSNKRVNGSDGRKRDKLVENVLLESQNQESESPPLATAAVSSASSPQLPTTTTPNDPLVNLKSNSSLDENYPLSTDSPASESFSAAAAADAMTGGSTQSEHYHHGRAAEGMHSSNTMDSESYESTGDLEFYTSPPSSPHHSRNHRSRKRRRPHLSQSSLGQFSSSALDQQDSNHQAHSTNNTLIDRMIQYYRWYTLRMNPFSLFFILDILMLPFTLVCLVLIRTKTHLLLFLLLLLQCVSSAAGVFFLLPCSILIMIHPRFKRLQFFWTFPAALVLVGRLCIFFIVQGFWFDGNYGRDYYKGLPVLMGFLFYGAGNFICCLLICARCVFVTGRGMLELKDQNSGDSDSPMGRRHIDHAKANQHSRYNEASVPRRHDHDNHYIQAERTMVQEDEDDTTSILANRSIELPTESFMMESNLGEDIEDAFHAE